MVIAYTSQISFAQKCAVIIRPKNFFLLQKTIYFSPAISYFKDISTNILDFSLFWLRWPRLSVIFPKKNYDPPYEFGVKTLLKMHTSILNTHNPLLVPFSARKMTKSHELRDSEIQDGGAHKTESRSKTPPESM